MQQDHDPRPAMPLEARLVRGVVQSNDGGSLHLRLLDNPTLVKRARVTEGQLPAGTCAADFNVGSRHDIFLERPTSQDNNLWHANLALGDKAANPWFTAKPHRGEQVEGVATHYVKDFGVIVRIENGMDALLLREGIPFGRFQPITHSIHLGDRVAALVESIDVSRLDIQLSVNLLLNRLDRAYQSKPSSISNTPFQFETTNSSLIGQTKLNGQRVLIVDDNPEFSRALKLWLEALGAHVTVSHNPQHIEQVLRQSPPRFVLLDFNLGGADKRREIHALFQRKQAGRKVALMSGDYTDAQQTAEKNGWPFLSKPLEHKRLLCWLNDEPLPPFSANSDEVNPLWGHNAEQRDVLAQAERHLETLCRKTACQAALWVQQQRQGAYAALAWFGVGGDEIQQIEPQFGQSLVEAAVVARVAIKREVANSGPFKKIAPAATKYVMGVPLTPFEEITDVLVVFSNTPFESATQERLEELGERLGDFAEHLLLMEHMREVESFAVLGRAYTGLLHEVRGALDPLVRASEALEEMLKSGKACAELKDMAQLIAANAKRAAELSRADLRAIQKTRREQILLIPTLRHIVKLMNFTAHKNETDIRLNLAIPDLSVSLPPHVLEQSLINLLDNAIHHCKGRTWARIAVEAGLKPNDRLPIHIRVRDEGRGMKAEEVEHLFRPRVSVKGEKGVGLGLYVSRNLLKSVGGELDLEKSVRWLGSSFLIKLPMVLKEI